MALSTRNLHLLQVLLLVALIVLTVLILYPFQRALDRSMMEFRGGLISYLEGRIGRKISFRSISPAVFRHIEIRDLSIFDPGGEVPLLTIRKIRVSYNLLQLMSSDPLAAIREIRFENTLFNLDTETDDDLLTLLTELGDPAEGAVVQDRGNPLNEDIIISGRNLSFRIRDKGREYRADELFFDITREESRLVGELRGRVGYESSLSEDPIRLASAEVSINGKSAFDFRSGELSISLRQADSNLIDLERTTFFLAYRPGEVEVRKIQDREPFDLSLRLDSTSGIGTIDFQADGFVPARVLNLKGELADFRPWLGSVVSGDSSVVFELGAPEISYRGDLALLMDNEKLIFPLESRINFVGDQNRLTLEPLLLNSSLGRISYYGDLPFVSLLPAGELSLRDIELPTGDMLNADIRSQRRDSSLTVEGGLRIGSVLFPDLRGELLYRGDGWEYNIGVLMESGGENIPRVEIAGGYYKRDEFLQSAVSVEQLPLERLVRLVSGSEASESLANEELRFSSSLFLYREAGNFTFLMPDSRIENPTDPRKQIEFQVSGGAGGYSLVLDSLRYGNYTARGTASLNTEAGAMNYRMEATVQDIPYLFEGRLADEQFTLQGTYVDRFLVDLGAAPRFSVATRDFPVPVGDTVSRVDLNLRGTRGDILGWSVWLENSRFANLPFGGGSNSLTLTGRGDSRGVELFSLVFEDGISRVAGNGYFRSAGFFPETPVPLRGEGWLQLASNNNEESYQLILALDEKDVESDLLVRNAPLSRFGDLPLRGLFSGDVTVRGLPTDPDIFVRLELNDSELNQDPFSLTTVLSLEQEVLSIREFELDYLGMSLNGGSGQYSLREGGFDFSARLRLPLQERVLQGSLGLQARTVGLDSTSQLQNVLKNPFDGNLFLRDVTAGDEVRDDWELGFGYNGQLFAFFGGPGNSISGTFDESRSFSLAINEPMPLRLRLNGTLLAGEIDAEIESLNADVEPLKQVLRFPFFALTGGGVSGEGIRVRGPVNDPDFSGLLRARNLTARSPVIPESVGPFDAVLRLEGKTLAIGDLQVPVGLGSISADLRFALEHWIPATYDIRIDTGEEQGVHVKTAISQLEIDGYARGTFTVIGDNLGTEIGGDLSLSSAIITLSGSTPEQSPPGARGLRTDFTFVTGRSVEFLWPSLTLPILRSFAKTGQEITIRSDSVNDSFSIDGEVAMQGGIILYFQRNFYIKEGSVRFQENEIKFDPVLSARAELREVDENGDEVQIFLVIDARPFSQFTPRFESIPSRSDAEIAALLGTSIFGGPLGEPVNPSDALIQTSDLLVGQLGIVRSFEQSMKEILNLDLFSIRTQILQNILLDRMVVEEQGDQYSAPASSAIGRYLDNTTLFLGKYFGDDVFLEAMLQVQSNEQFFSTLGIEPVYELETEISLEWDTPFFLLDLSVSPDFRDIVSSITTARVGLSWALSF